MGEVMTVKQPWTDPTVPLENLARTLNFGLNDLQQSESSDELNYTDEQFESAKLGLTEDNKNSTEKLNDLREALQKLREKYGTSLTFSIRVGQLEILSLEANDTQLYAFYEAAKKSPILVLYLRIDKAQLVSHWQLSHPSAISKLFLFPEALIRALSVPLKNLEQGENALFRDSTGDRKLFIFVPKHTIALNGDYLAVLGGERIGKWKEYLTANAPNEAIGARFVRDQAADKLIGLSAELHHLTPLQLYVDSTNSAASVELPPSDDPIAGVLFAQLVACSILYMAIRSTAKPRTGTKDDQAATGRWVAIFKADKYLARLEVSDASTVEETLKTASINSPWETAQTIAKLAQWIYKEERGVGNRLTVIQVVVASSLQDGQAPSNLAELARRASELFDRVQRRWDAFIEEKLDKYFLQIKELEDAVSTTTKSYDEQIQSLTKSLIDNMLAAVGVVVGSFIAAIFKSPFETAIFWFGTGIYLGYLLVFPIIIGLTSAWQRFSDSRASFKKRKEDFSKRLTETEVNEIVGTSVKDRESWFKKWFWTTAVLYAVVLVVLLVAIDKVPNLLRKWGDSFELSNVSYGEPVGSDTVPLIIRGANFDGGKEIVVDVGNARFTNTDRQTVKVLGSTVLTLSPRQEDVETTIDKHERLITVRQGSGESRSVELPQGAPPIPRPVFDTWIHTAAAVEAAGSSFGSIFEIMLDGQKLNFKVSGDGKKLQLSDQSLPPAAFRPGKAVELILKNRERMQETIR